MSGTEIPENTCCSGREFGERFLKLTERISYGWLDRNRENIQETQEYDEMLGLFPPLAGIFRQGLEQDPQEFFRTVAHVFQTLSAYNRVLSGDFPESGLEDRDLAKPHAMARAVTSFSPLVMPVILYLHDIGRFEDKRRHTEKSAEMITSHRLLEGKGLSEQETVLILKVVEHHLLMGTLYTGESSYLSFEPLLKDEAFRSLLVDKTWSRRFIDCLTLFTMIDVWGYHLRGVSSTSIADYLDMKREMEQIFTESTDLAGIRKTMRQRSRHHLEWRLMGCMAAFANIGRQPHLTMDFYRAMIQEGFKRYIERQGIATEWNRFKDTRLDRLDQAQFKYALGVLVPLSFGGADKIRQPAADARMNPDLFHLLVRINDRIAREEDTGTDCVPGALWEVIFTGYPAWDRPTNFQAVLEKPGSIDAVIARSRVSTDREKGVNALTLDFAGFWEDAQGKLS